MMSGVIVAMRRTLLSWTALVLPFNRPATADELRLPLAVTTLFDFNHQDVAVLTTALALLSFSVLTALLIACALLSRSPAAPAVSNAPQSTPSSRPDRRRAAPIPNPGR